MLRVVRRLAPAARERIVGVVVELVVVGCAGEAAGLQRRRVR